MERRTLLSAAALGGAAVLLPDGARAADTPVADLSAIHRVVSDYFRDRAARVTALSPGSARAGGQALTDSAAHAYGVHIERLDARRAELEAMHGGYVRSATSVTIKQVTSSGSAVTLVVTEQTNLYFAGIKADVDHTTYWVDHEVDLHRNSGRWLIARVEYLPANAFSTPVTQFTDELPADLLALRAAQAAKARSAVPSPSRPISSTERSPSTRGKSSTTTPDASTLSYDYSAMVTYARNWAYGRNPAYPSYSDDCTSFVSQCMKAGGWATVGSYPLSSRSSNSNWWYGKYASTSSYTWGGAENWYWFATGSGRTSLIDMWSMGNGDVLQYDYDYDGNISHTQICTSSSGPLMTQHGGDYRDKPLSEIMADSSNYNAWKYAHRT